MTHRRKQSLEMSLIENCVKRSREIIYLKAAKLSIRDTQLLLNGVTKIFPDMESIQSLLNSVDLLIQEHKLAIAKALKPVLLQHDIKINEQNGFWFTHSEMLKGYAFIGNKALFLGTTYDGPIKIEPGELHEISEITHVLKETQSLKGINNLKLKYATSKLIKNGKKAKKGNDNN